MLPISTLSVLDISEPGLNIYLTGDFVHWERNEYLKYDEMLESYLLFGFQRTSGDYFKHFVLCENRDAPRLREIVQCAGYEVTGTGSKDAEPGKRRVWFCLPDYPIVGDVRNNMWP